MGIDVGRVSIRRTAWFITALTAVACSADQTEVLGEPSHATVAGCVNDSTWAVTLSDSEDARIYRSYHDFANIAGLEVFNGSVYAYDSNWPRITNLSIPDLAVTTTFGREGSGPGELQKSTRPRRAAHALAGDRQIAALDFRTGRVHAFTDEGKALEPILQRWPDRASRVDGRIFLRGDTIFYGSGYFDVGGGMEALPDSFVVRAATSDSSWVVAGQPIQEFPTARGGIMLSRGEARPLFALSGDCVYLNNGHDLEVVRVDRRSASIDTLRLGDIGEPLGIQMDLREPVGVGGLRLPAPSLEKWVDDLSIDPAGGIWLHLVAAEGDHAGELVAYLAPGGTVEVVRTPIFPRVFGGNGELIGVGTDSLGMEFVLLVDRQKE